MKNTRGSEWHKWDLHLHTASSYDSHVMRNRLFVAIWIKIHIPFHIVQVQLKMMK